MDEVKQKLQTKLAEYDKQHQVCVFFNIGFYYIFQIKWKQVEQKHKNVTPTVTISAVFNWWITTNSFDK